FEDEASNWTDGLLERLRRGDRIVVPAHWPVEVSNGLLMALRRKRIRPGQPALFLDEFGRLPIDIEQPLTTPQGKAILDLGEKHGLTIYDAAYFGIGPTPQLPFGTLDHDLRRAAAA